MNEARMDNAEIDYVAMGNRIKWFRKAVGMTQADLAASTGLSTSFCGHIERGTRIASLESLLRIADVLNTNVHELLTGLPVFLSGQSGVTSRKSRMFTGVVAVLSTYADEWLRES